MAEWKTLYMDELKKMDNEQLLDDYTNLAGGDDYDGCYTSRGAWQWEEIKKELLNRLNKIGFLES